MHSVNPASQNGNVLFIILIAVALFAALSYAISSSSNGGSGNPSNEKSRSNIAVVQQYAASISGAITKLMVSNSCSQFSLNFYSSQFAFPSDYLNPSAPLDKRCNVFDVSGGGVAWQRPPESFQVLGGTEYAFSSNNNFNNIASNGCADTELVMYTIVDRDTCVRVNSESGIINPGGSPPQASTSNVPDIPNSGYKAFKGSFGCGSFMGSGVQAPEISGKMSGCFYHSIIQKHYYYEILMPR